MRILLEKGKQKEFISKCCNNKSLKKFLESSEIKVPYSTLKGYYQEKLTLPLTLFGELCKKGNINETSLVYKQISDNWGAVKGGKKGIRTLMQRYPEKIRIGRIKGGKASIKNILNTKNINELVLNEKLAEIIGAYLGDGTLTEYFMRITGDKRYDLPYFRYLFKLIEEVTGITSSIRESKSDNTLSLDVGSKKFCEILKKDYGLDFGSKIRNQSTIPQKIINDKKLFLSCLRGLMDTDGSISKDNDCLSARFSNHNTSLLNQIKRENKKYNIFKFESKVQIGIKSKEGVKTYFKIVGSSNLRHITRFQEFLKGNLIKKESVLNYYPLYKDVSLPYNGPVV